jgi:putative transposase
VEELLSLRGIAVDHATIQRWVFKFTPLIKKTFEKEESRQGIAGRWMKPRSM